MVFHGISKKASLVGAFFMAALFFLDASAASCPKPHSPEIVRVARVVDGDTLKLVDGRSVRLIGVNAPELAHRGRSEEPFAVAAQRRLEQLVAANDDEVGLVSGRQGKDKYGRTLAHAYDAQGNNLESRLLAEGLGYLVAIAPNTDLTVCQQAAERGARSAGLGLWKRSPVQTPQQLHESGFAVVRGRIEQVERNRGGMWIDFDGPLVLRIDSRSLNSFDADALRNLRGRQVEARGWVIDRAERGSVKPGQARWMLPLTDPAMMEVLP